MGPGQREAADLCGMLPATDHALLNGVEFQSGRRLMCGPANETTSAVRGEAFCRSSYSLTPTLLVGCHSNVCKIDSIKSFASSAGSCPGALSSPA